MPRLSRCLSNAFPDPHCACSMIPVTHPNPHTNYNYFQLTWAVIGCLCFTSGDSYQASGDRSQPNLFAWHRKKRCTACQHILCAWKNMLRHSQYNQPWIKWPSAWHMWKAVHYIGLFLWKHPSYGADLNNSNIKEVWLIYWFFFYQQCLVPWKTNLFGVWFPANMWLFFSSTTTVHSTPHLQLKRRLLKVFPTPKRG